MTNQRLLGYDAPLTDPDNDLLGVDPYAKRLADFVTGLQLPFTIGIYGAWGSGKSTFVRFVEHYLRTKPEPLEFITLEAWPFKTSDDLWRALVQKIAQQLYGAPEFVQRPPAAVEPGESFTQRLGRSLRRPAFRFVQPPRQPDPLQPYYDLLSRLDHTLYGDVRSPGNDSAVLDEDATVAAVVQGTVNALGAMSPLIAAMRTFFGFDARPDVAQLLRREKNEATRRRIESVAEFRKELRRIFADRAAEKRVCVFVDDLDRCMPDVAVDLLEALKIFLGDAPCLFIVALDEQLVKEGLRLRYQELLKLGRTRATQELFEKKATEYFEKIIQLGIRVPDHSSPDVHQFIAAQFPQWLAATDLIQTAIGTNPRRLKQYCTWLNYKNTVARSTELVDTTSEPPILEKLIELHSWNERILRQLSKLALDTATFPEIMARLEKCLSESKADTPRPTAKTEIANDVAMAIYHDAVMSDPLQRILTSEPLLSSVKAELVATLASFADVRPAAELMLRSNDLVMMRILQSETRLGKLAATEGSDDRDLAAARLLVDDLTHLIALEDESPEVAPLVEELAGAADWNKQMLAVETAVEGTGKALSDAGQKLVLLARQNEKVQRRLLELPRFSTALPEAVTAWAGVREQFPAAGGSHTLTAVARAGGAIVKIAERNAIERALQRRIDAARYFISLRKFVKLDGLTHCWSGLAESVRSDIAGIRNLESNIVDQDQRSEELPPAWQEYLKDEKLVRFLRLRPYLRDIYADELPEYLKLTESIVPSLVAAPATPQAATAAAPTPSATAAEVQRYTDIALTVTHVGEQFHIELTGDGLNEKLDLELDTHEMEDMLRLLDAFPEYQMAGPELAATRQTLGAAPLGAPRGVFPLRDIVYQPRGVFPLREIGHQLFGWFFRDKLGQEMHARLQQATALRLLVNVPPQLMRLPWEALYAPAPLATFFGLTRRYSIVRRVSGGLSPTAVRLFAPPLRIVALFSTPSDVAPLKLEQEEEMLRRVLGPAMNAGTVLLDVLKGPAASYSDMNQLVRKRRPHIFHFSGHGLFREGNEGSLVFDEKGSAKIVSASDMATLLRDSNVSVAVLSGCDTGRASTVDISTGVAGALTQAGIPAVIATTRAIMDDAGLLFAREFYRSLFDGFTVEASLIEARKALSVEKWDWSAFALFSCGANLDELRLESQRSA